MRAAVDAALAPQIPRGASSAPIAYDVRRTQAQTVKIVQSAIVPHNISSSWMAPRPSYCLNLGTSGLGAKQTRRDMLLSTPRSPIGPSQTIAATAVKVSFTGTSGRGGDATSFPSLREPVFDRKRRQFITLLGGAAEHVDHTDRIARSEVFASRFSLAAKCPTYSTPCTCRCAPSRLRRASL
jgi:hypothetical protein